MLTIIQNLQNYYYITFLTIALLEENNNTFFARMGSCILLICISSLVVSEE